MIKVEDAPVSDEHWHFDVRMSDNVALFVIHLGHCQFCIKNRSVLDNLCLELLVLVYREPFNFALADCHDGTIDVWVLELAYFQAWHLRAC